MHAYKGNKNSEKALIAAEFTGVKIDVAPGFEMFVTNQTPQFLKMNPLGKVLLLLFLFLIFFFFFFWSLG